MAEIPSPTAGSRKWWTLGALVLSVLAVGLDGTILSVALPTLAGELHASTSQLQWFVAAYTLVLAAAMLPGGLLGDRYGRKRMLLIALAIFGVGSIACAYSTSPEAFIAARVLAGLGAALVVPVSLSVLTVAFTDEERPKAVGAWAAANFLALPIGPILGGWILNYYWWGWVFLLNVPVVLVGMAAAAALLPESRSTVRPDLDAPGILTSCLGPAVLTYGFIQAGQNGWGNPTALIAIGLGLLVLAGFVAWELAVQRRGTGVPLVDLGLFRSRRFTWGTVLAAVGIFAMFGVLFAGPQYFQAVLGADAMGSGVRLLPLIAGIAVGAGFADRLATRVGAKVTVTLGFVVLAIALFVGTRTDVHSPDGFIAAWTAACGVGMGMALATTASAALGELNGDRAGVGSALMQTVQKAGAPLAVAVLGSVLNTGYQNRLPVTGLPGPVAETMRHSVFGGLAVARQLRSPVLLRAVQEAFAHGMSLMLLVSALLAVAGAILSIGFMPGRSATGAVPAGQPPHAPPAPDTAVPRLTGR